MQATIGRGGAWRATLRAALLVLAVLVPATVAAPASADEDPAAAELATRFAPVVRVKEMPDSCGIGDPYQPVDIDVLLENDEVVLRGPWDTVNVAKIAPSATDIGRQLYDYHLDFPGDALRPGCTYERWQQRLASEPVSYARVVTEEGVPGKLAVQYWFYYIYNDWGNKHEGDWEMIQLNFAASTPAEALATVPYEVGYSQHKSGERATWGDDKLELVDGTHPVVYPARGSQANFFGSELYLMRSTDEGVGCDDTTGPSRTLTSRVALIPTAPDAYLAEYPWLAFEGRWGEKHAAFFNGPTGPNMKTQWTHPFTWASRDWRTRSLAVPTSGAGSTPATDVFCGVVQGSSEALRIIKINPLPSLVALLLGIAALAWALSRTAWSPSSPELLRRRRAWGQLLSASVRRYASQPVLFLAIGSIFLPIGVLLALLQWLAVRATPFANLLDSSRDGGAVGGIVALVLGVIAALAGLTLVQAAVTHAVVELDAGRRIGPVAAYRFVLRRWRPLLGALAVSAAIQVVLDLTLVLVPVAIILAVRWSLLAAVVATDETPQRGVLRRSAALVRGHWWRSASIGLLVVVGLLAGPLIGVLVLVTTGATFAMANLVSALIHAAVLPVVAIVTTYLHADLTARREDS